MPHTRKRGQYTQPPPASNCLRICCPSPMPPASTTMIIVIIIDLINKGVEVVEVWGQQRGGSLNLSPSSNLDKLSQIKLDNGLGVSMQQWQQWNLKQAYYLQFFLHIRTDNEACMKSDLPGWKEVEFEMKKINPRLKLACGSICFAADFSNTIFISELFERGKCCHKDNQQKQPIFFYFLSPSWSIGF